MSEYAEYDRMLKPADVARMFGVDPKTVRRWSIDGKLSFAMTCGGHRRYPESEIRELLQIQSKTS